MSMKKILLRFKNIIGFFVIGKYTYNGDLFQDAGRKYTHFCTDVKQVSQSETLRDM